MKLRVVAGLLLTLVGVGLPLAAMSKDGPPWGFRGHQAVVLEVAGTVEATSSEARQQREGRLDDKLEVAPNARFDVGDEVRVARLSQARLRFQAADVAVGDGARIVVSGAGVRLFRGAVDVALRDGARNFPVELDSGGVITVRGAGSRARIMADGKGGTTAWVQDGSLEARTAQGEVLAEPGRRLVVRDDQGKVTEKLEQLEVSATCSANKINVVVPAFVQVFAAGTLAYPDVAAGAETGSVVIDIEPSTATPVFVRDVFGAVATTKITCEPAKRGK